MTLHPAPEPTAIEHIGRVSGYLDGSFAPGSPLRKGRSVRDGYVRGWGLQFGELRRLVGADPLYRAAVQASGGRSVLAEDNRMNLFLILCCFLPRIARGHIVEFGAYRGGNALFMAYVARRVLPGVRVYALDTFGGMPSTDAEVDAHRAGDFAGVDLEELRAQAAALGLDNLAFVQGRFEDTAANTLEHAGRIALAHIDCDIYSAVRFAYAVSKPQMVLGGYFVFDDAAVASCIGATEAVEEAVVQHDGRLSEQVFPHYVFRHLPAAAGATVVGGAATVTPESGLTGFFATERTQLERQLRVAWRALLASTARGAALVAREQALRQANEELRGRDDAARLRADALQAECERLRRRCERIDRARAMAGRRLAQAEATVRAGDRALQALGAWAIAARAPVAALIADRDDWRERARQSAATVEALRASRSWRVTAPLRAIGAALRGLGRSGGRSGIPLEQPPAALPIAPDAVAQGPQGARATSVPAPPRLPDLVRAVEEATTLLAGETPRPSRPAARD